MRLISNIYLPVTTLIAALIEGGLTAVPTQQTPDFEGIWSGDRA